MTLYDADTRCFIENKHGIAGLDSRAELIKNRDGSVDLYFGPEAPKGKENNWIPTVPGQGWFAYGGGPQKLDNVISSKSARNRKELI